MPNEKLTAAYWNSKTEIIEAATQGWNPLDRLPKLLKEAFSYLKNVEFGFFSESDLPEMFSQGWELFTKDMFDADEFNKSVIPARYGLTDDGSGALKWRDNYLMIMGKDFRNQLMASRHAKHEDQFVKSIEERKFTMKGDPQAEEMAKYSESKYETKTIKPTGKTPEPKRGPGRPPKKK
jgi:hypothetical protein